MPKLTTTLTMMTLLGCRRPSTWTSRTKKFLYKLHSAAAFFLLLTLLLMAFLDLILLVENEDEFSDGFYTLMPGITSICKLCNFLANHKGIMILIHSMQTKPYSAADEDEWMIETRFDDINERMTMLLFTMFGTCGGLMWTTSLFRDPKNRDLAFRAWVPYDYKSPAILYAITYIQQAVSVFIGIFLNVTFDSLFSGLLFCIYSHLEILGHRLRNINRDQKESAKLCVRHHIFLFDLVEKVNEGFRAVLLVQFVSSMVLICFIFYRIVKMGLTTNMIEPLIYAFCILLQTFYYCWNGNEVMLKSLDIPDSVMSSNWPSLDETTKKMLLMIMIRSTFPMQFTSGHFVSMNMGTFMTVCKTSYSAFNVLQGG